MGKILKGGLIKEEKKMSKLNKKLTMILIAVFALTIGFAITGFATTAKADTEAATCPTSGVFEIQDKVGVKLNDDGGMRWILKMDEAHYKYINDNTAVELGFVIAPKILMDQANGDYYGMQKKIVVTVDKNKIYQLTDDDGYYYANGCVTNMKAANRNYDYTAAAYIKNGETIEKQAAVNENSVKSFYTIANSALLYPGINYSKTMLSLPSYSNWLGTEAFPIKINTTEQYNSLVKKINAGEDFSKKTIEIANTVNQTGLDETKFSHYYKDGACTRHENEYQTEGIEYKYDSTKECYYVSGYTGTSKEVCVLSKYNNKSVGYVGFGAFNGNVNITKVVLPESVKDLYGNAFFGCTSLKYVFMPGVTELNYSVGDVSDPTSRWGNNNFYNCTALETVIVGNSFSSNVSQFNTDITNAAAVVKVYVQGTQQATVPEDKLFTGEVYYKGDTCENWNFGDNGDVVFGSHSFEDGKCTVCDEDQTKGIIYGYDESKGCYYVSGYTGSSSEVYVRNTYNDGNEAHGSKSVTYVKNGAFSGDNRRALTKVVLPSSITRLEGDVFKECARLKYVSMTGVENLEAKKLSGGIYDTDVFTTNNFINCGNLKTLIVGKKFVVEGNQFVIHDQPYGSCVNVFVTGAESDGGLTIGKGTQNELLTGEVYYKGDHTKCMEWDYDNNGNAVQGAKHIYIDGKCKVCSGTQEDISYELDTEKDCYYVSGYTGTSKEVYVCATYDDGTHGEKAVTYIAEFAFMDNTIIKKVILPDSIKSLDGCVFQGCTNLEYVSMTGVENLDYNGSALGYGTDRGNNFMNCTALKYVILNPNFTTNCQQFFLNGGNPEKAILDIYVNAASGTPNFGGANTNLLTGTVYYYSETKLSGAWHYVNGTPTLWA